jgi:hypothetical protein
MDEVYAGTRTGLSQADITAIQAIYGPRTPDAWAGNNSVGNAYSLTNTSPVVGQLLSTSQTDYYKFTNASSSTKTTISLSDTGLSLLEAKMTLLSSSGTVLGTATVTDPRSNNLSLILSGQPAGTYYVEVQGANTSVFGMGEYSLSISTSGSTGANAQAGTLAGTNAQAGTHTAMTVNTSSSVSLGLNNNNFTGSLSSAGQVATYTATTPASSVIGSSSNMIVSVSSKVAGFSPRLTATSSSGATLQTVLLAEQNDIMTIEVLNVAPATTYTIRVSSGSNAGPTHHRLPLWRFESSWVRQQPFSRL